MKKITLYSEPTYLFANILMALAVAMTAAADFGVSMIVSPAYILHLKIGFLSFGQCEYLVQGVLFLILCLLLKKVKAVYFFSFFTCLFYGLILDLWRLIIPWFNPAVTAPGSFPFPVRLILFALGEVLTAISVALFFRLYLYPQVVDFFVKGVAAHFHLDLTHFKILCDGTMLLLSVILSLVFFAGFRGIGWGTLVLTLTNGAIIGLFSRFFDKILEIRPLFPRFAAHFELS